MFKKQHSEAKIEESGRKKSKKKRFSILDA